VSRYHRTSVLDPALTVAFGWDRQVATFYAWAGPDEGDCDPEELVFNVGDLPGEVLSTAELNDHMGGHYELTPEDHAALYTDQANE
jgi:hypothetical protein